MLGIILRTVPILMILRCNRIPTATRKRINKGRTVNKAVDFGRISIGDDDEEDDTVMIPANGEPVLATRMVVRKRIAASEVIRYCQKRINTIHAATGCSNRVRPHGRV